MIFDIVMKVLTFGIGLLNWHLSSEIMKRKTSAQFISGIMNRKTSAQFTSLDNEGLVLH